MIYRCGFAADSQVKRDDIDPNTDYLHMALGNVKEVIAGVCNEFDGDRLRLFLTGSGNFREQVATIKPYKGNRDPTHKPKYYREIKDYMLSVWNAELVHGREADDALGCAQWEAKDKSTVLCTIDKDLDMIPGHHYNFVKKHYYYVDLAWANSRLFWQMLVGDTSDNIPGIKGVGPKKADKVIAQCGGDLDKLREEVKRMYDEQYGTEGSAAYLEVGTLLWMQRKEGQECPLL